MRRQTADHDCGPTAVANALERYGRRLGLAGLRALCGTDVEGTDEQEVIRALLAYRCGVDEHRGESPYHAHAWLLESLVSGRPVLLCVDRWGHWVTALGACGRDVVIYDPARETGGATVARWPKLRRRWEAARRVRRAGGAPSVRFYGIGVGPPDLW